MERNKKLLAFLQDGTEDSLHLAHIAAQLAQNAGCECVGVTSVHSEAEAGAFQCFPIDRLVCLLNNDCDMSIEYIKITERENPAVVLISPTTEGKALASVLALHFKTGVAADCTELYLSEDMILTQKRPAFGGSLYAWILTENSTPQIATAGAGLATTADVPVKDGPLIEILSASSVSEGVEILSQTDIEKTFGVEDAKVLFVAGGGIRRYEDIALLEETAKEYGGALACSRAITQRGWMKQDRQIGLSGKAVRPNVLVTFGVSGSEQFLAGIRGAKFVVAINNDPEAPIFSAAELPILGDLYDIASEMRINKLKDVLKVRS